MDGISRNNKIRNNLGEIYNACLRARDVVKQILAFSRQTKVELKPVQIGSVIEETIKLLRSSIPRTIEIRPRISAKSDVVRADATQINQVLINLCTNAFHAMRDRKGILEINLETIELDDETVTNYHDLYPGKHVRLTVRDTGHGMESEIMDRIFEPYFTTKEVGEGSGMGLAVAHGIVKNHGGDITAESAPGEGATLQVILPVVKDEVEAEEAARQPVPKGTERVLFVDDEESLVFTVKYRLQKLGYTVIAKQNPVKALDAFRKRPDHFDLVITDMTMPEMTGDVLTREVMKIRPDIPVILCTGFSESISEEEALAMGVGAFVMKPVSTNEMAKTIRKVLDSR